MPGDDDARLVAVRVSAPTDADVERRRRPAVRRRSYLRPASARPERPTGALLQTATDHYLFVAAYTDPEWMRFRQRSGGTWRRPGCPSI